METMEGDRPYKIYCADLWECPTCGHQLITGFGARAISEHYMAGFNEEAAECTHRFNGVLLSLS